MRPNPPFSLEHTTARGYNPPMSKRRRIALVDGYNVIHRTPDLRRQLDVGLEAARNALVRLCAAWRRARGDITHLQIVFDGDSSVMPQGRAGFAGIDVLFTHERLEADDGILNTIRGRRRGEQYLVVSDDNYVVNNARALGATVIATQTFRAEADKARRRARPADGAQDKNALSDTQKAQITRDLMGLWTEED